MDRRPPLLFTFPGVAGTPDEAIDHASTIAGAWLQEQSPSLLFVSTNLTFGNDLWCYVITITWVVSAGRHTAFKDGQVRHGAV
jgi:hypothetical protein